MQCDAVAGFGMASPPSTSLLWLPVNKTWGFPSQFIQINKGVKGYTTRAQPGVPYTRAGLEAGTSRFSTRRINHYATRGGSQPTGTSSPLMGRRAGWKRIRG